MTQLLIEKKVIEIYDILKSHTYNFYSLYTDAGGQLLFLYEYWRHCRKKEVLDSFTSHLHQFVNNFTNTNGSSFCAGWSGNMWLLEYFKKKGIIEDCLIQHKKLLNDAFLKCANDFIAIKHYDFLHGLLGMLYSGYYCPVINRKNILKLSDMMLKDLKIENETAYFLDWNRNSNDTSVYSEKINFGLSHGLPSAIIVFLKLSELNTSYEKVVYQLSNFIIRHKRQNGLSYYDSVLYDRKNSNEDSRLAWCYGDLGIALALWQAGKKLNENKFVSEAVAIIENACRRKNLPDNLVFDAGLCHGSSGIAKIFNCFHWATQHKGFKSAADYWINITLEQAKHSNGLAGYCSYHHTAKYTWDIDFGLLEGISGIGLSLLSALNRSTSHWDEAFLMFGDSDMVKKL